MIEYLLVGSFRQRQPDSPEKGNVPNVLLRKTVAHDNSASIGVLLITWVDPTHAISLSKVGDYVAIGKALTYLEQRLYLS
jgi:hypothetical protein